MCPEEDFGLWSGRRGNQILSLEEFSLEDQLTECLPSMREALGFTLSTSKTNSGDA